MSHFSIPACYFPSTAFFIDDNRDFLLNFVLQLDEWLAYRMFDSPFDALNSLQKKQAIPDLLSHRCINRKNVFAHKKNAFAVLHQEIYNSSRFSDVSVVIVDYSMPGMNGLDFCREILNPHIKKILLTGKADEELAVEAVNEGLIHRYLYKNDPLAPEIITRSIYDLQWEYFQDISEILLRSLPLPVIAHLTDKKFIEFFHKFREDNEIIEFYLADETGSFLLLDVDANISTLLVDSQTGSYSHVPGPASVNIRSDSLQSYHQHLQEIDAEELLLL